jgi:hypothetical protein
LSATNLPEPAAYGLTIAVLTRTPFVPISEDEFGAVQRAKAVVSGALGIEETFNLVVGNYREYEMELLGGALSSLLYTEGPWSEFTSRIHEVNRRLMNLLAAGRAYLDQAPHHLSATFGPTSTERKSFRLATNAEYDGHLGYRVMEELRNFALHRGLAVHHLSHDNWADGEAESRIRRNALVPSLQPKWLEGDGGFKPGVLEELRKLGDTIDLRPLVKQYLSGLARVHDHLRGITKELVGRSDQQVVDLIDRYKKEGQADVHGLVAVRRDTDGRWLEQVAVFDDPILRRRELVQRLRRVQYVDRIFTTNEPRKIQTDSSRTAV